jgi:putative component of membrane protein insertase Oxa1/YidC/SpoIIIJ protein YidD
VKYLLILSIKLYWTLIPAKNRRKCLFATSCSNFVHKETLKNGFIAGLKALNYRYKVCRSNYIKTILNNEIRIILSDGTILKNQEINPYLKTKE